MVEGEKKEKRIFYYIGKGPVDFFNLRANIFVGPYKLFDPQALLSMCSKDDRKYILDCLRTRVFKDAYETIDRILGDRKPFGGEKRYIRFYKWGRRESRGVSKKQEIYRFIRNSIPFVVWKGEVRKQLDYESPHDATKIDRYIKDWMIRSILDGSIFSKSLFGNRYGREYDLIRFYVSHKFGWI